jgi:hypothetical protein
MLQPHSFLWHYLWVGPHAFLLVLAMFTWRRDLRLHSPAFFTYLVYEGIYGLVLYVLDRLPSVSNDTYWRAVSAGSVIELSVKIAAILELSSDLIRLRPSLGGARKWLVGCVGAVLAALATLAAAHTHAGTYVLVARATALEQGAYMLEAGLLLSIFLFAAYQHLVWERRSLGIALGLSISACVGLGVSAAHANGIFFRVNYLDFVNMGSYHLCVLIWFYYLVAPDWHQTNFRHKTMGETREALVSPPLRRLMAGLGK